MDIKEIIIYLKTASSSDIINNLYKYTFYTDFLKCIYFINFDKYRQKYGLISIFDPKGKYMYGTQCYKHCNSLFSLKLLIGLRSLSIQSIKSMLLRILLGSNESNTRYKNIISSINNTAFKAAGIEANALIQYCTNI